MGKSAGFVNKKEEEKEFVFDPLTAKAGDDTWTLTWEKGIGRFDLRKNGGLLFSDVGSHACAYFAKEKGVEFRFPVKKAEEKKK